MFPCKTNTSNEVVIVEDAFSAIRVGEETNSCALLGTAINAAAVNKATSGYSSGYLWMDSDAAGRKAAKKLKWILDMQGIHCVDICTPKDPKKYSKREIKEILVNARLGNPPAIEGPKGIQ